MSSFISISLVERALEVLSEHDFIGKDIPYMHQKTVEYLLKQGVCICGTHLDEGSVPYNKLKELIDYLPPQSISNMVSDFKKEAKSRAGKLLNLPKQIKDNMAMISEEIDEINDMKDELQTIEAKLSGGDVRDKVRAINNEIQI